MIHRLTTLKIFIINETRRHCRVRAAVDREGRRWIFNGVSWVRG